MAVWNTVNISYVLGKNRIDADFYKKPDVELEGILSKICSNSKLRSVAYEIPEKFNKASCTTFQYNDIGNTDLHTGIVKGNIVQSKDAPGRATFINQADDILISTVRPNRNANAIVNQRDIVQVGSNGFCNIRSRGINPNYIYIYSKTWYFISTLIRATTSSMYPSVSNTDILNVPFFIPNNNEVGTISSKVQEARNLLLDSQRLYNQAFNLLEQELNLDNVGLDLLSNKYVTTFNEVIIGKRLDPEYFNPRTKAIVARIKDMQHTLIGNNYLIKNGFPWNSKKFIENNTGEPVIRIRDIKPTYIDRKILTSIESKYANSISFPKGKTGDVVIGMDGLKYFYASIIEDDCMINQRVCHLVRKSTSKLSPEYVVFIVNSKIGQAQLLRDMTIATTVGHITNLNIGKIVIPIVSDEFHNKVTGLVRKAIDAEKMAKLFLHDAKKRVESLIEEAATKNE